MFNKSEIMKYAHQLRKTGYYNKSTALKTAWAKAKNMAAMESQKAARKAAYEALSISEKIEELENRYFMMNMAGRLSFEDRQKMTEIRNEINQLKAVSENGKAA